MSAETKSVFDESPITDSKTLEFTVFCIENLALKLHKSPEKMYSILKTNGVINDYIVPEYEVLHTQSKDYIIDELIQVLGEKGVAL